MADLVRLEDRAVVEIGGPDAVDFLQGIITNSVANLPSGEARYAALLSPQGKLLFDFFISCANDLFYVELTASIADDFVKRLMFYRLRAQVEITKKDDAIVAVGLKDNGQNGGADVTYEDPRLAAAGHRHIFLGGQSDSVQFIDDPAVWRAHRIAFGIPEGGVDFQYGDCFPHDIAMDQLNGIAFDKGCYVGQEVVSRMRHRGTARKRPLIVLGAQNLPDAPLKLEADGSGLGDILSVSGPMGLSIVRLDRAETALEGGKPLSAGGVPVELKRPAWAGYAETFDPISEA
jgi:folate-binding protein YgfZ